MRFLLVRDKPTKPSLLLPLVAGLRKLWKMVPQYDRMPDVPDSDDDMNDVQDDGDVPTSLSTVFEKGMIFWGPVIPNLRCCPWMCRERAPF